MLAPGVSNPGVKYYYRPVMATHDVVLGTPPAATLGVPELAYYGYGSWVISDLIDSCDTQL